MTESFRTPQTPEQRVAELQHMMLAMDASGFADVAQLAEFMDLYSVHCGEEAFPTDEAKADFMAQLDMPDDTGRRFGEYTFDSLVFRHDDILKNGIPNHDVDWYFIPDPSQHIEK